MDAPVADLRQSLLDRVAVLLGGSEAYAHSTLAELEQIVPLLEEADRDMRRYGHLAATSLDFGR